MYSQQHQLSSSHPSQQATNNNNNHNNHSPNIYQHNGIPNQITHHNTVIANFNDAFGNSATLPNTSHGNMMNQLLSNNNQQSIATNFHSLQQYNQQPQQVTSMMNSNGNLSSGSTSGSSSNGGRSSSNNNNNYIAHNFVLSSPSSSSDVHNLHPKVFNQNQSTNHHFQNQTQQPMMNPPSQDVYPNQINTESNHQWNQSSGGLWSQLMGNPNTSPQTNMNNFNQPIQHQQNHDNMNFNYVNNNSANSQQNNIFFSQLLNGNNVVNTSSELSQLDPTTYSSNIDATTQEYSIDEPSEAQFHPIACLGCRKIHKRCDKKLPVCTRCSTKGLNCEYKEPFFKKTAERKGEKKKRKKKGDVITMFNVGDENEMAANAIKSIKQNTIETYCSIVCMGNPPFNQEDLEQLLLLGPQELLGRRDIFGFLLSIQALCELKFGYPDLAEESMVKARNSLGQHFDDYENPFVVCTYSHLAFFSAAEGKTKQARGYLSFVNHYVTDWKASHPSTEMPHGEISGNLFQCSLSRLNWMSLITELISTETHPVPNISTIEKLSLEMLGLAMPEEWKVYLTYYQLTDCKNVDERLKTLELFGSLLHFAMGPQNNSVFATKLHGLNNIIVINGIRATVLLLSGCNVGTLYGGDTSGADKVIAEHINLLEYAALAISKSTEEELFPFISPYLISFFLLAVKVNLEICKMIDRGERENYRPCPKIQNREVKLDGIDLEQYYTVVDYYSVLAKDLRGLQVLRKRYRYIAKYVTDVEEFMAKRANQSLESIANFANSSIIPDLNDQSYKTERIGTFYGEMRKFMLTFNKGLGEALLGNQQKSRIPPATDNLISHPALSMVMSGAIKPGNVDELSMFVSEISKNVREQADALRDLSTPSSCEDIELDFASTLDPFQAHSSQF